MKTIQYIICRYSFIMLGMSCLAGSAVAADAVCGDAVVQAGEACDDGNQAENDFCNNKCQLIQNKIEANNRAINFDELVINEDYHLKAPAAILIDQTCVCAWSVEPDLLQFSPNNACITTMTADDIGTGLISLDVRCDTDVSGTYAQKFKIYETSPSSEDDDDNNQSNKTNDDTPKKTNKKTSANNKSNDVTVVACALSRSSQANAHPLSCLLFAPLIILNFYRFVSGK